jgi:DNA invertase Pin-like site-specific DNA recombinase
MICAIYARVSKERCTSCGHFHDDHKPGRGKCLHTKCKCSSYQGQDPENQLVELRRYATAHGWEIVEYIDHATGKNSDRDAMQAMFEDASRKKFDVVVVWALDRLTREGPLETMLHVKRLADYGVQFESYTEPYFRTTGPAGELLLMLFAWIAKQERIRISDRTKAGLATAKAKGVKLGRPQKVFRRDQAAELRRQGWSWRRIAKEIGVGQSTIRVALASPKKGSKRVCNKPLPKISKK